MATAEQLVRLEQVSGYTYGSDGTSRSVFLSEQGFVGPTKTNDGIAFRRDATTVEVNYWQRHHEAGFHTRLRWNDQGVRPTSLDRLYVDPGRGSAQDVPTSGGNGVATPGLTAQLEVGA